METYIQVSFWLSTTLFVLRLMIMSVEHYPRKVNFNTDVASVIMSIPFIIWAGILLWGIR